MRRFNLKNIILILFSCFIFTSCFSFKFDEKNYGSWIRNNRKYEKCAAKPDYRKNITKIDWMYKNKVENSKYCRNYQVFICNQLTVCKNDMKCEYASIRYYWGFRTKEELIESKKHVFKKDLLKIIDKNIENWKPYNEYLIEETNKRENYCNIEREICNNSKQKDKTCIQRAKDKYKEIYGKELF